jgi:hypothetical protein
MGLRVRAKALGDDQKIVGYYDHIRRRPGDEFEIESEEHFSYFWMDAVGWEPPRLAPAEAEKRRQAYGRRLSALANGTGIASQMRDEDLRHAQERDAIRKASPSDLGVHPPAQRRG